MTRLLVSVRNAREAEAALAGGADLIDVKEPARGALGAADAATWRAVTATINGRAPVSAALGELLEMDGAVVASMCEGLSFVKAGLAGAAQEDGWPGKLQALQKQLPVNTQLVAVAYADHAWARSPSAWEVLDVAVDLGLTALLIDTFDKRRGDLWSAIAADPLAELVAAAQRRGFSVALAGSLQLATLARALALRPNWIAVRGAACAAGRETAVAANRVAQLKQAITPAQLNR